MARTAYSCDGESVLRQTQRDYTYNPQSGVFPGRSEWGELVSMAAEQVGESPAESPPPTARGRRSPSTIAEYVGRMGV